MTVHVKPEEQLRSRPLDYPIEKCCVDPDATPKAPAFWPRWSDLRPIDLILLGSITGTGIAGFWIGLCWKATI